MERITRQHVQEYFSAQLQKILGGSTAEKSSNDTGIPQTKINAWINGRSLPKLEEFITIYRYFNCKAKYFLGY